MSKIIKMRWAEHTHCEFELKDVEATMATMTANPSINNVPTMIGGTGYDEVYHFYKYYFIPSVSHPIEITQISCTVDNNRLVSEQLFGFVHDYQFDFMLPSIPPTGKTVIVPMIVIVSFENDKVASEHIYWDQASVLKQIGLIRHENWPVLGAEQAHKFLDSTIPSNKLLLP